MHMINLKLLQEDVCSGSHSTPSYKRPGSGHTFGPDTLWGQNRSMDISERTPLKNYMGKLKIIARIYVDLCGNILSESQ